jgi:DNA-binding NarL/FixJ family response regulator
MSRSVRSVVVVSAHPQRADLLDAMLVDTNNYDVVYVESVRKGYSRIRRVTPDLVVFQGIDDVAACRLLSMLKIDGALSGIPVLTCAMRREESEFQDGIAELDRDSPSRAPAIRMN